jgi:predicted component of type VI protein secretion system
MTLRPPVVVRPERIRRLPPGFGWIDHRFVRHGFAARLSPEAQALYLFLATVADEYGVSWYSTDKLCLKSGLSPMAVEFARKELTAHSLLAYARPVYQLLSLPEAPVAAAAPSAEPAMATAVQAPGAAGHPNNSPEPRPAQPPPAERFGETLSASQILRRMLEGGAQ